MAPRPSFWRGFGPLLLTASLLLVGAAGLIVWLQLTHQQHTAVAGTAGPAVVVPLPQAEGQDGGGPGGGEGTVIALAPPLPQQRPEPPSPAAGTVAETAADESGWASANAATVPPPFPESEAPESETTGSATGASGAMPAPAAPEALAPAPRPGLSKPETPNPALAEPVRVARLAVAPDPPATTLAEPPTLSRLQPASEPPAEQPALRTAERHALAAFPPEPGIQSDRPKIAVVVGGLGLSSVQTAAAISRLPPQVTLAFAPYGRDLQTWVDEARAGGHEVILELPMEPVSFPENDPGPHTLLTSLSREENLARLDWVLDRFNGYSAVINYMGSRFTTSRSDLVPVMKALKEHGLAFLDGRASANSVAADVAADAGLAVAINDRYVDAEASREAISARLAELERIARTEGRAVGVGYSYPVTAEMLAQWAPTLASKGLELAPLSAVMREPGAP